MGSGWVGNGEGVLCLDGETSMFTTEVRWGEIPEGIADCAILWVDSRFPAARASKR